VTPVQRVTTAIAAFPDRLNGWLATVPSTNARIVVTLGVVIGTAVRFWWKGAPSGWEAWLTFLAAMSGLDATQFYAKRKTQHAPDKATP
jgi:hypothetical protein